MLREYLQHIFDIAHRGDAREESYYSSLEDLIKAFAQSTGKTRVHVTTLPKKTEAGNPDFRVWDGKQHITGYIEAKKPTEENLNQIQNSDQLKRYRDTFPNLILTNFFEFRLYRNGQLIDTVQIGRPFIVHKLKDYQVLDKWLKDRRDRTLSMEDIRHYCRIVTALAKTIELQAEIDRIYPKVEDHVIEVRKS